MFKTAATKIAHNSTLTVLAGNQDLRPLQDLITAEKTVLISLQKLSVDYSKAAEALRAWGLSEGDDLGDILSGSTNLLTSFSSALSQYAAHGHVMRDHLKGIRTREEALDEVRRRRRAVHRKADDAEKKLSKMSPEHKNLGTQTELLNRLKDEIRSLDSEIMTEEAALSDFKRSTTRAWVGLKFGGLLECSEKGTIVGEYGKLVVSEMPEEVSQPGMPRSLYYGHSKVESLVTEALRCINEVTLPSSGPRDQRSEQRLPQIPPAGNNYNTNGSGDFGTGVWPQGNPTAGGPPPINTASAPRRFDSMDSPLSGGPYSSQTISGFASKPMDNEPAVDDFGVNGPRSGGPFDRLNTAGGRFATFPVKNRQGAPMSPFSLHDPPSLNTKDELGDSFSFSIAEALDAKKGTTEGIQQPWHGRLSGEGSAFTVPSNASSLPPPPPGAQAPEVNNPWTSSGHTTGSAPAPLLSAHTRQMSNLSDNDDALLAYMTSVEEETQSTPTSDSGNPPRFAIEGDKQGWAASSNESDHERKAQLVQQVPLYQTIAKSEVEAPPPFSESQNLPEQTSAAGILVENLSRPPSVKVAVEETLASADAQGPRSIRRVPPPAFNPEGDDRALNAAAALEISREMEEIKFEPPILHDDTPDHIQADPDQERGRTLTSTATYSQTHRDPSPLAPPSAPFAQRSVSPHPFAEIQHTPAQLYAQSYQSPSSYSQNQLTSPPQTFAQSYRTPSSPLHSQSPPDSFTPPSTLPPRFQSLNHNSQIDPQVIPPRFQTSQSHSPASPHQQQLPPRLQAAQHQGASVSFAETQDGRFPSVAGIQGIEASYRTPPEYPRGTPTFQHSPSPANNFSSPVVPPGTRTISAAAFKRPPPHKANSGDFGLGMGLPSDSAGSQKRLPSSPYPQHEVDDAGLHPAGTTSQPRLSRDLPSPPADSDDYHFDYISAYQSSELGH